ncbi:hypothetical protein Cch01nite_39560 [Cellulomonas chitinilytica]|uniref:Uncharacterized protein n=1 Tax=Cellulomonas chitinilytica TaxID=398759 RepID=A0A919P4I4_9CELL|nr:hypothetical protein Cch01nite_39560 [Cellulomonas chitinilytica]
MARTLQEIGPVDAGARDLDEQLRRSDLGIRHVGHAQDVRIARLLDHDGAHNRHTSRGIERSRDSCGRPVSQRVRSMANSAAG